MKKLIEKINLETVDWTSLVNECLKLINIREDNNRSLVYELILDENMMKKYGLWKTKMGTFSFNDPEDKNIE